MTQPTTRRRPHMPPFPRRPAFGLLLAAALASGCAQHKLFDEGRSLYAAGQYEAGLAKLEEAVRAEPGNAELRIALTVRRTALLQRRMAEAELARRTGRMADAERSYRQALDIDPNHVLARQGLQELAQAVRHERLVAEAQTLFEREPERADAALDRLRAVLAAEPRNAAALKLKDRIDQRQLAGQRSQPQLAAAFRKPITLQFADAPLRTILDAIGRLAGLSFFLDKDVRPDARGTVLAQSTTVEDTLRLLLLTNQLDMKVLGDASVLVYPATQQKQREYQALVVRSFFLANADVKSVSNAIKTLVKTRDLVIDERLGTITMRDTPEAVRVAERIVALHDISDPEVMLEVEVLEIKRSRLQELGVQWPGRLALAPLPSGTSGTTTLADLLNLNRSTIAATLGGAAINASTQDQDANILTNPRIRVRNKDKAKIQIGDRIPVITSTTTAASGTTSNFVADTVTYLDVGLKLDVEPTVYLDDEVAIKLSLEVSNLVREVTNSRGTLAYQVGTRSASTVLRLKDGETQVLAGLISDEDRATASKVPGLGDMPMLGRLFGSQRDDDQRSEILLSITPRVLRGLRRPDLADAEFDAGTEAAPGAPRLLLQRAEAAPAAGAAPGGAPAPAIGVRPTPSAAAGGAAGGAATASPPANPASPATNASGGGANRPAAVVPQAPATARGTAGFAATPLRINAAPAPGAPRLLWQGPQQVRTGQPVTVLLRGQGAAAWHELALQLEFDPAALEILDLRAGALFDPSDGRGSLLRNDGAAPGQVAVTLARPADSAAAPGTPPDATPQDLLVVTLRARAAAGSSTQLQLRRADAPGGQPQAASLPEPHVLRLVP